MPQRRAGSIVHALRVVAAALVAAPAAADEAEAPRSDVPCGERAAIVDALERRYDEIAVARGIENNGELIQLFASARTGTWTILATRTDGVSCVLAVGEHFEPRRPRPDPAAAEGAAPGAGERPG